LRRARRPGIRLHLRIAPRHASCRAPVRAALRKQRVGKSLVEADRGSRSKSERTDCSTLCRMHGEAGQALSSHWPSLPYEAWRATCDTLHSHTQVLGKLAVVLAEPEPELGHGALRLTARGWETSLLPAPDDSGGFSVVLDLHAHEAVVEHVDGRA